MSIPQDDNTLDLQRLAGRLYDLGCAFGSADTHEEGKPILAEADARWAQFETQYNALLAERAALEARVAALEDAAWAVINEALQGRQPTRQIDALARVLNEGGVK